jgi:hypothetical protein
MFCHISRKSYSVFFWGGGEEWSAWEEILSALQGKKGGEEPLCRCLHIGRDVTLYHPPISFYIENLLAIIPASVLLTNFITNC